MKNILIFADPTGNHSLSAIKKGFKPENIWVWENDPAHFYAIKQIDARINLVEDINCLNMNFDLFDLNIGNPPFKGQLHLEFLKIALQKSKNVKLIHPSGWLYRNNNSLESEVKKLLEKRLTKLTLFNGDSVFTGTQFQSPLVITEAGEESDSFILKYGINGNTYNFNSIYDLPCGYWEPTEINLELKEFIYREASKSNLYSIFGTYENGAYLNLNEVAGHHNKDPNSLGFSDDFYTFFYRNSNMDTYKMREKVVNLNHKEQKNYLISYLKTKFPRFALALNKVNSWNISRRYLEAVPIPPLDRDWNDDLVKEFYNLTEEQWNAIDKFIPTYYS